MSFIFILVKKFLDIILTSMMNNTLRLIDGIMSIKGVYNCI